MSASGQPDPPPPHDLRLAGPAVAVWLTASVTLGAGSVAAYTVAAVAATATLLVLRSPTPRRATSGAVECATTLEATAGGGPRPGARWWRRFAGVRRHHRAVAGATLAGVAAAAACAGLRLSAVESGPLRALARAGTSASIVAEVTTDPRVKPSRRHPGHTVVVVRARALSVRSRGRTVRVRVPMLILAGRHWTRLSPSQPVRFTARLAVPSRGALLAAVGLVRGPPTVLGPPSAVQRAAGTVRARLREAASTLPPDQRGVLPGLVLGDTSSLDPELETTFTTAGLSHLLVVSGANLSLVAGAILGLARLARLGRRRAVTLAAVAIVAFVVVVRPEPSVLRATAMALISMIALVSGREHRGVPALCAAVVLLVLADPELARAYGFALSVLATAGLLVLAPRWRPALGRRLPAPLADAVAVAAAAQLAVLPVLVTLSGEIGLVTIPANVLAAPAVAPATLLGALTAVVAPVAMPLARILVWPAGLAVGWICGVARAAAVPHANLSWPAGAVGGLAIAAIAIVGLLALRHGRARRMAAAGLAGVLFVAVTATVVAPDWPPRRWRLVACDVGQGDALVLAAGSGAAVVVDTGPEPHAVDRCLRDLRISTIPLLVLTHPHADHVGGVTGAVRDRALGTVLLSPATAAGQWRDGLPGGRTPVRFARAGQRWTAGEVTLTVLGPPPIAAPVFPGDDGSAVNNISVVMLARWPGLSALLTGDAEEDEQRALVEAGLPPATVLKVPHHGSDRQDAGFLAASRARLALISVGRANDYGHPAPELRHLLHRLRMRSYRTDEHGDIAITRSEDGLAVVPRGPSRARRDGDPAPRPPDGPLNPRAEPRPRRASRGRRARR